MGVGMAAAGSSGEGRDGDGDGCDWDERPRRGTRTAATETKKKVIGFCFWVSVSVDHFFTLDSVCLHLQYYTYVLSFSLLFETRQKLAPLNYSISTLILARGNKLYFDIF